MGAGSRDAAHPIRVASRDDIDELSAVLSRAFYANAVTRWLLPDDAFRRRKLAGLFAVSLRYAHVPHGSTLVGVGADGGIRGGLLLNPPNTWPGPFGLQLRQAAAMVRLFGAHVVSSYPRFRALVSVEARHPRQPHWYFANLGIEPSMRGQRLGQRLMESGLARCDADHLPAYGEAASEFFLPRLRGLGFKVVDEVRLPGGPTIWLVWRRAR